VLFAFLTRRFYFPWFECNIDGSDDGIESLVAGGLALNCFQTRTGIKFVLTAEPGTTDMSLVLKEIYILYTECVLKDPFYELEMPIRSELFIQSVDALIERVDKAYGLYSSSKLR
jgi:hypothetical protein